MVTLSRRALALAFPTASLAMAPGLFTQGAAAQSQGVAKARVSPAAQVTVGRYTITALTDGYADMPFSYFPGSTPADVEAAARAQHAVKPGGVRFVFNAYLIDDGERLILVDTGPAGTMGKTGQIPSALEAIGIRPDQISAVIATHMHVDHLGGLVANGRRNFPQADLYLDRRDLKHWTDPAKRSAAPDFLRPSFDASAEVVRLYPNLQAIDGEREIVRGVSVVDLTGHTPGHIGVRVEDGGQSLLMVSDMLFPVVHPASAGTGFLFEQDPAAARAMRTRFFPQAASDGTLIAATHMPFPGLGRIVRDEGKLRWLAADWDYQG
ncbi:MAG: MBL-fold metallo-hydrolase superfamily [uncultured Chloroflexia bacterium]|uniref:MBL-fold metallo-hydrolase superfamily n=1 Tax=uncultured Chloroflexia bacterium TaxID=1672391 RepID=A0A6J4NK17_9CHLR|nr:MAG: MBL-fold metallo-hydrolase superfamily [uncultured Chloroflexia bacterium]